MTRGQESLSSDYYERLGVDPCASADEIRAAYREKARQTHPDRNPDDPGAVARFRKIKEAYRVLRDPEERAKYDATRTGVDVPETLRITQEAPIGCTGYFWRVLAGLVAVGFFMLLEAFDVWASADGWTIALAVAGASLAAGVVAAIVAKRFPDEAADVMMRLSPRRLKLWADGRAVLDVGWPDVRAVRLRPDRCRLEVELEPDVMPQIRPIPPVLTSVEERADRVVLELDLSDADVRRGRMQAFLRGTSPIPFSESVPSGPDTAGKSGST